MFHNKYRFCFHQRSTLFAASWTCSTTNSLPCPISPQLGMEKEQLPVFLWIGLNFAVHISKQRLSAAKTAAQLRQNFPAVKKKCDWCECETEADIRLSKKQISFHEGFVCPKQIVLFFSFFTLFSLPPALASFHVTSKRPIKVSVHTSVL